MTDLERERQTRAYWDRVWSRFLRHHAMIAPAVKLLQLIIPHVPRQGRILDLGCGEGRNTLYLSRAGFQTVGLDLSAKAVRALGNNLFEEEAKDGGAVVGDARRLPFAGSSFDGVLAHHLFDHLDAEGMAQAMLEAFRVLQPGGILLLTLYTSSPAPISKQTLTDDDGTVFFAGGTHKGLLTRPLPIERHDQGQWASHGWDLLKDELTPRQSRIVLIRKPASAHDFPVFLPPDPPHVGKTPSGVSSRV
jgi:SAM-dependent methyltransferase